MAEGTNFTTEEALRVGEQIGIDLALARFDVEQIRRGMEVELVPELRRGRATRPARLPTARARTPTQAPQQGLRLWPVRASAGRLSPGQSSPPS